MTPTTANNHVELRIKKNIDALDAAISAFRKNNQDEYANNLIELRDYVARSKGFRDRLESKHNRPKQRDISREVAEVMWEEMRRNKR